MSEHLRLNVYLSKAGHCSRRKADELIEEGVITINHAVVRDCGYEVQDKDTVRHLKKVVKLNDMPLVVMVMNKPAGTVTTAADEKNRLTVLDHLKKNMKTRVYPVGRLDINTTGALLLTNDGDLAYALTHPSFEIKKVYKATLSRELADEHLEQIKKGVYLDDGKVVVDSIHRAQNKCRVTIFLHSGKNRIIRRIFEKFGYMVQDLERTLFATVDCKRLSVGEYRFLSPEEIEKLKEYVAKRTLAVSPEKKIKAKKFAKKRVRTNKPRVTPKIAPAKKVEVFTQRWETEEDDLPKAQDRRSRVIVEPRKPRRTATTDKKTNSNARSIKSSRITGARAGEGDRKQKRSPRKTTRTGR